MPETPTPSTRPPAPAPAPSPAPAPGPAAASGADDALRTLADVARAAPRVWAWWPAAGGRLRVSGRPPAEGGATATAEHVIELLQRVAPEAVGPELRRTLQRAQRGDGGLASPVLLRALQRVQPLH